MNDRDFWKHLESMPAQAAPWCEWQHTFSAWPGFESFQKHYLQPTERRATSVDCVSACPMFCPRKVVQHSETDIVAVCPEGEEKPYSLIPKDILVYKLKCHAFHKDLCAALGIHYNESRPTSTYNAWRLGVYKPREGFCWPVFLIFPENEEHLVHTVRTIGLLNEPGLAIITPTTQYHSPEMELLLSVKEMALLTLDAEFTFDDQGRLAAHRPPEEIFAQFHATIPGPNANGETHFPTPSGTTWEQITIEFVDGHTVSVRTGALHGRYSFAQLGMANQKSNTPNRHWTLLQKLAEGHGTLTFAPLKTSELQSELASLDHHVETTANLHLKISPDKTLKKHKQGLSKALRTFFHLQDDPIEWNPKEACYHCRFVIRSGE